MKTMNCKQLGGACKKTFSANTFEELVELSKQHGMDMLKKQDAAHVQAMAKVNILMQNPTEMQAWFDNIKAQFEDLPEDD
ncbi:hypothetical protein [uncultured Shewanella sp.]|uniref:hypothetical protein n=1 Tax=uncultured Shewanella sp. TaxID=173975 RepID=UPI00261A7507|nr:hypothetical protein [uncultured Shewanella sp.]